MRAEAWQPVQRLLLWMSFDAALASNLRPAIQIIQQTLPRADLTIWTQEDAPLSQWLHPTTHAVAELRTAGFDAAIILTLPQQSPYARAYLCYLARIPIRVGQSREFGGSVLSHSIQPPLDSVSPYAYQLHLLQSLGFPMDHLISGHLPTLSPYPL